MGQLLHACARTTEKVRRDIQNSEESLIKLSKRYGINPKTVAKWAFTQRRKVLQTVRWGPKARARC